MEVRFCTNHATVRPTDGALAPTPQVITGGWGEGLGGEEGGVSQEEGHATGGRQVKVYTPLRPLISASVDEKCCHNVNEAAPTEGRFQGPIRANRPVATKRWQTFGERAVGVSSQWERYQ